ncbi:MAG: universal stress protein [Dissulfurispiraceae bacterium]
MKIKSILLPTDFSDGSLYALSYAVDMAKANDAKLYLLHVLYDIASASGLYIPHTSVDVMYREMEETAKKELERFGWQQREGLKNVEYSVIRGLPYEEILKCAKEKNIDLIVIGTHGKTGIDRVIFGSTAQRVVRHSTCPVLTVKATK